MGTTSVTLAASTLGDRLIEVILTPNFHSALVR
jgi:hypothetical protein